MARHAADAKRVGRAASAAHLPSVNAATARTKLTVHFSTSHPTIFYIIAYKSSNFKYFGAKLSKISRVGGIDTARFCIYNVSIKPKGDENEASSHRAEIL
jgi:hypothetical protein